MQMPFIHLFGFAMSCLWHAGSFVAALDQLWHLGLLAPRHAGFKFPEQGIKPVSLALHGVFLITGPPGKAQLTSSNKYFKLL